MMTSQQTEWLQQHSQDMGDYPLVFGRDFCPDIEIPNHPEYYVKPLKEATLTIRITTFRGSCVGSRHFYASIEADAPKVYEMIDGEEYTVGGYICQEWQQMPKRIRDMVGYRYRVNAVRPLTQGDIDCDPVRWEGYKVGDYTNGFDTKESALAVATQLARCRFPDWKVEIDDLT